jgi:signal transduction histidine kinase
MWTSGISDCWDAGLIVLDHDDRIALANALAYALFGATTRDDLEQQWLNMRPQINPNLAGPHQSHVRPGDYRVTTAVADVRIRCHVLESSGDRPSRLLVLHRAEHVAAFERTLRGAARDRARAALARDTSHDLRDALNVISISVELLRRTGEDGFDPARKREVARSVDAIRRELRRLDRAADGLLKERGNGRDSPQLFDVSALCRSLVDEIAARTTRQQVLVSLALMRQGPEVRGFPDRLSVAIVSLLVNALDAMPNGGALHLAVTRLANAETQIHVRDSGPGIPSEQLSDIWKLYSTTKARGAGIGLPVARAIVESHGGTIHYQPNGEGGSSFVIALPPAFPTEDEDHATCTARR